MFRSNNPKLSKVPSNTPRTWSEVNFVTWRDVVGSKKIEAEEVAGTFVNDVLNDVERSVDGRSSCSIIPLLTEIEDSELLEDRRLSNWQRWIKIREKESMKIKRLTYRNYHDMLLNLNPNEFRKILNRKKIIEKSAEGNGALEFWKIPEKSRKELHLTLPKSQRTVKPFELIYTQTPDLILKEQNLTNDKTPRQLLKLVEEKLEKVTKIFDPKLEKLSIKGNDFGDSKNPKSRGVDQVKFKTFEGRKKSEKTQILLIEGIQIDSDFPDINVLVDLVFEASNLQRDTKILRLENRGEIAMNFTFEQHDESVCKAKVFFFNKSTHRIVPDEALDIPIHFYSQEAGLFHELWTLNVLPGFSQQCSIRISLLGHVKKRNINDELDKIERDLVSKAGQYNAEETIKQLLQLSVSEQKTLLKYLCKDPQESQFIAMNPKLHYHPENVQKMTEIFNIISEADQDWDYNVEGLYKMILQVGRGPQKKELYETFIENFNQLKNVPQASSINEEKSIKFSLVRNVLSLFIEKFERFMMEDSSQLYCENLIKNSFYTSVNKIICILES